jgi:hypothetical protein
MCKGQNQDQQHSECDTERYVIHGAEGTEQPVSRHHIKGIHNATMIAVMKLGISANTLDT